MIIYGAGLAGLVTAHCLRRHSPILIEQQSSLPNNHAALLRFRSDAVARTTGIPFREVRVSKSIWYKNRIIRHPNIEVSNLYSFKVTGEYSNRSIGDLSDCTRYIAPPDLISQLARGLSISYGRGLGPDQLDGRSPESEPIISTIPMPTLIGLSNWPVKFDFRYRTIWSYSFDIVGVQTDLFQTIYYPDPALPYYRASITGNRFILEFNRDLTKLSIIDTVEAVLNNFGIRALTVGNMANADCKEQKYGKLLPIDDQARRAFILAMTDRMAIYSIGRFATWRQILMDDVVKDAGLVDRWVSERSQYRRRLEQK